MTADYWKSQPKKFCQYCKCWIADNKPSIEFHERGKNHKENVSAKIAEIKKKSMDKAKQEERMSKEFAAMEEAAMKAYKEDMKRMGIEPESKWEKPEGFQGGRSDSAQLGQKPPIHGESPPGTWMEAVSPDGYTYFYNTETGESSWERPADLPSVVASGSSREGKGQQESSTPSPAPLSGGEESSDGAQASKEAGGNEQASQEPTVPKTSFRKRKAVTESSEKEGEDNGSEGDDQKEDGGEKKGEEEAQSTAAAPEEKKKVEETRVKIKKPRTINPYGTWEQIQQEEDPYAKVDLQLPQVEGGAAGAPDVLPPEPKPKPKFKERIITSLGEEGGPASFRKSKTQNGKSRSIRQRGKDD
ncbi:WW domain-binding protein 4 [Diretmus argenteus]